MKRVHRGGSLGAVVALVALLAASSAAAPTASTTTGRGEAAAKPIKIGIVSFLTGPAASPFGIPGRNGAQLLIERLNAGKVPAPYAMRGIGGRRIQAVYVDEAGGADQAVANFRRLVQEQKVDLVIGYISSGDCLAVGPVADQLKQFTIFYDCGASQLFQNSLAYVFRTAGDQSIDAIGAARYVTKTLRGVHSIAGINQNYAWGQDNWNTFAPALSKLVRGVDVKAALFPNIYSGQYSAEISRLLSERPDVIYSSFWGGDLESFLTQAIPRGLHRSSTLVFSALDTALPNLGRSLPDGIVVGARGPHGVLAPSGNPLNKWLVREYTKRFDERPVYPVWHMAQAIFGAKAAYERAMKRFKRSVPATQQWMATLRFSAFDSPSGKIRMTHARGHQAVEDQAYGTLDGWDSTRQTVKLKNVVRYPARCVQAPARTTVGRWIADGFPGARCP